MERFGRSILLVYHAVLFISLSSLTNKNKKDKRQHAYWSRRLHRPPVVLMSIPRAMIYLTWNIYSLSLIDHVAMIVWIFALWSAFGSLSVLFLPLQYYDEHSGLSYITPLAGSNLLAKNINNIFGWNCQFHGILIVRISIVLFRLFACIRMQCKSFCKIINLTVLHTNHVTNASQLDFILMNIIVRQICTTCRCMGMI